MTIADDVEKPFIGLSKSGQCKHEAGQTAKDTFFGALHGAASLFGLGSITPDPLGDAQKSVSNALSNIASVTAKQSLAATSANAAISTAMFDNMQLHQKYTNEIIKDQTGQLWEAIKEENLFLLILGMLIFMLIFFFLLQKKCC